MYITMREIRRFYHVSQGKIILGLEAEFSKKQRASPEVAEYLHVNPPQRSLNYCEFGMNSKELCTLLLKHL